MKDSTTEKIIGAAIEVHRTIGPGLLESVYEECMAWEMGLRGIPFERQKAVSVLYKGHCVGAKLRIDLLVNGSVIVELKSVESLLPVRVAQLLSYLRLSDVSLGLLINFNVPVLKDGIKRVVHHHLDSASPRLCVEGDHA